MHGLRLQAEVGQQYVCMPAIPPQWASSRQRRQMHLTPQQLRRSTLPWSRLRNVQTLYLEHDFYIMPASREWGQHLGAA